MSRFFSKAKAEKAVNVGLDALDMGSEAIKAKGELISNVSDSGGAALSMAGVAGNTVGTVRAGLEAGSELKKLGSAALQKKELKDLRKDPHIRDLLQEREHCSIVLQMHNEMNLKSAEKVASNMEIRQNIQAALDDPASGFTQAEKDLAAKQIGQLDAENEKLLEGIARMQTAVAGIDARITEINQMPEIAALRPLEAKVDLAKEVLKDKTGAVRAMLDTGERGLGVATDGAQLVLNVVQAATPGVQAVSAATSVAGPAISMAAGGVQAVVSGANLALDVREALQHSKMAGKAQDARQVAAAQGNDQLEAAFKRVQLQAQHMKCVKTVEGVRDVTGIVAGTAAATAGAAMLATTVAGLASAPGFSAGAVVPAVVTVAATGVGVGSAAVCIGAEIGVVATKQAIKVLNERIAKEANVAISGLDKLVALAKDPNANTAELPISMEERQAIKNLQDYAVAKGKLTPEEAGDLAKLRNYAECRAISREDKKALEVISKELMWECKDALLHRKGTSMVPADLPNGGPAVEGLRKLGVNDRDIVSLANATAHLDTREIGMKNLASKTGLKA